MYWNHVSKLDGSSCRAIPNIVFKLMKLHLTAGVLGVQLRPHGGARRTGAGAAGAWAGRCLCAGRRRWADHAGQGGRWQAPPPSPQATRGSPAPPSLLSRAAF